MYLIDTSVWIDYINGIKSDHFIFLDELLLADPLAIGLNEFIYMEILQGAKSQKAIDQFTHYFSGKNFYYLHNKEKSYAAASKIYFDCRRKGITIRSSIDCLIAQCALENDLILLHNDRDFQQMANVITKLKHKCFL